MRRLLRLRLKFLTLIKILSLIVIISALGYLGYQTSRPVHFVFVNEHASQPCNLPVLDPFDPSIQQFFWKPEPVSCPDYPSIVFIDEDNVLHLNLGALDFFGIRNPAEVLCSTESVYREEDDYHVGFNLPRDLELPAKLEADFNRVTCKSRGGMVLFQNVIAGIGSKPQHAENPIGEESEDQLSVIMFGLDSVSRSASVRYLPKTLEVLQKLGSYDFRGVMKNGDNTIPNIIAQLSGLQLWKDSETKGFEGKHFDYFPMLWKNFSVKQYVTLFSEDLPWMGMFNNGYKGYRKQPTDHYMRPFWLALGKEEKVRYHLSNVFNSEHREIDKINDFGMKLKECVGRIFSEIQGRYFEDKGIQLKTSSLCNQNTMNHMEIINYIKRFLLHYKTKKKFAYSFLTELSHSFINFLHHGDEDFKNFFLWLNNEGFLNRTIVVFFSDHGSRFEEIRNTFVGRIESRMPVVHMLLPEHIKKKYPDVDRNLRLNTQRLVSQFDIYQTMIDVVNQNFQNPSTQIYQGVKRGVSLFQEISDSRSCNDSHIPADFCACYKSTPVNITNNESIRKIAVGIVDHLNELLKSEQKCKVLTLNRILSAQRMSQGLKYEFTHHNGYSLYQFLKPERSRDSYSVIIETVPGHGTFDASCELEASGRVSSIKTIDRTNAYGNQSSCISNNLLKQYCYC